MFIKYPMFIKFKWEIIFLSSAIKLVEKKTFSEILKNNTAKRFSSPHCPVSDDLPKIIKSHSLTSDHFQLVHFYLYPSICQTLENFKSSLQLRKKNIRSRVINDRWETEKTSFLGDLACKKQSGVCVTLWQCVGNTANPAHQTLHRNKDICIAGGSAHTHLILCGAWVITPDEQWQWNLLEGSRRAANVMLPVQHGQ